MALTALDQRFFLADGYISNRVFINDIKQYGHIAGKVAARAVFLCFLNIWVR